MRVFPTDEIMPRNSVNSCPSGRRDKSPEVGRFRRIVLKSSVSKPA